MNHDEDPTPVLGSDRISWIDSPQVLRDEVQSLLRSAGMGNVRNSRSISGGFSPGVVERLTLDDGQSVFFKASSIDLNPVTPSLHLWEARFLKDLESSVPCARWIATVETGSWGGLIAEFLDGGNPTVPVTPDSVRQMVAVVDRLAELKPAELSTLRSLESMVSDGYWMGARKFYDSHSHPPQLVAANPASLEWLTSNWAYVLTCESGLTAAVRGTSLLHRDLRTDNVIASPTRGFVAVDWAWACVGSPVFELVGMLTSLRLDGGPPPWEVISQSSVGRQAPTDQIRDIVAGLLGYFLWASIQPPPPGINHVRTFQARMALVSIDWLRFLEQS